MGFDAIPVETPLDARKQRENTSRDRHEAGTASRGRFLLSHDGLRWRMTEGRLTVIGIFTPPISHVKRALLRKVRRCSCQWPEDEPAGRCAPARGAAVMRLAPVTGLRSAVGGPEQARAIAASRGPSRSLVRVSPEGFGHRSMRLLRSGGAILPYGRMSAQDGGTMAIRRPGLEVDEGRVGSPRVARPSDRPRSGPHSKGTGTQRCKSLRGAAWDCCWSVCGSSPGGVVAQGRRPCRRARPNSVGS